MLKVTKLNRTIFFIFCDIIIFSLSAYFAFLLRFSGEIPENFISGMIKFGIFMLILRLFLTYISGLYKVPWRFFSLREARKIIIICALSAIIFSVIFIFFGEFFAPFARSVILIDALLAILFMGILRISKRLFLELKKPQDGEICVIIGATNKTLQLLKGFANGWANYFALGIVDPRSELVGTYCNNFLVQNMNELENYAKQGVQTAIISKKFAQDELNELHSKLIKLGFKKIKIFSLLGENAAVKDISIEDLLARKPKDLNNEVIKEFLHQKVILITGAGGTIGSQLSKLCLDCGCSKLILLDHSEYNLYEINEKLNNKICVCPILVNITDKQSLENVFAKFRPQIVLHAAAYKHVVLCELNPKQAVKNNILGTKNVIDLAKKYNTLRVVLISTDKAVRPTGIMGASKRICELYALNNNDKKTNIVAVRFGNVLGSSGSVIPKFKEQIKANKPLSVTHPDVIRYFMLVSEACQLVLQAAAIAKGAELFVLDMGKPVKIVDLAQKMLILSAKEELGIEFIGLRKGEKLFEELLIDENDKKTRFESIFVANSTPYNLNLLNEQINKLLNAKNEEISEILKEILPEFKHNTN